MNPKLKSMTRRLSTLALFAGMGTVGFLAVCNSFDPCANSVVAHVVSPGGNRKLVVFVRDCGATTSASPEVSLLNSDDELPNEPGNLLIIEAPGGPYRKPVRVEWENNSRAMIAYPAKSEIFRKTTELDGVSLTYVEE